MIFDIKRAALLYLLLFSIARAGEPQSICCKVVGVTDGDTVRVLIDSREVRVRLEGIDAPESKQPYGTQSKTALSELVFGKDVRLVVSGKDRYGRTLGTLFVGEQNVNLQMVRDGMAWHYKRFNHDETMAGAEREAREGRKGLWQDASPIAPWEWRRRGLSESNPVTPVVH